jgi:hypothetical protein
MQRGLIIGGWILGTAIALLLGQAFGAQQIINLGTPNQGDGDTFYTAFGKVKSNFAELYARGSTAEQFGGVADNPSADNVQPIFDCLTSQGVCMLGPGTYYVSSTFSIPNGSRLIGSGKERTTIKLKNASSHFQSQPLGDNYAVILGVADSCVVSDLTVDCNMGNQLGGAYTNNLAAVWLLGDNNRIERVRAIGWGVGNAGPNTRELFVLFASAQTAIADRGNTITECEVTGPYFSYSANMTTCILASSGTLGGTGAARVENNYVHDIYPTTASPLGPINATAGYGNNLMVAGNIVDNVYGWGFYMDFWTNRNVTVIGNQFNRVSGGVAFQGATPQGFFDGLRVTGNYIRNQNDTTGMDFANRTYWDFQYGVRLWNSTVTNVFIDENVIDMSAGTGIEPVAFEASLSTTFYSNVVVANNWFKGGDGVAKSDPGAQFIGLSAWSADKIKWANNRAATGATVPLKILNDAGNATVWLQDDSMLFRQTRGELKVMSELAGTWGSSIYLQNEESDGIPTNGWAFTAMKANPGVLRITPLFNYRTNSDAFTASGTYYEWRTNGQQRWYGQSPTLMMYDLLGSANNRAWQLQNDSESLKFYTVNDALGSGTIGMQFDRSANTWTRVKLNAPFWFLERSTPSTPSSGYGSVWTSSDNSSLYFTDDNGNITRLGGENWDDTVVPALMISGGASAPTRASFAGGPMEVYFFDDAQDDEAHFTLQLPHTYKEGTDLFPHVHFAQSSAATGSAVVWELSYSIQDIGETFAASTTIKGTNTISGTQWAHQIGDLPTISGTGLKVSAILTGRIRRLASSATADNYTAGAAFLGFDCHHQVDSLGSSTATAK